MSSNTTIARPYAKAAFAAANQSNSIAAWSNLLRVAAWIIQQPNVQLYLQNPKLIAQQRCEWLVDACDSTINEEGKNFFKLLADNKRLLLLPEIANLFEMLRIEQERIINIKIISAYPLDEVEQERIIKALKSRLQREIKLECHVDKTLIGGMIIRADDQVIDSSIRGKLNRLRTVLVNET